MDYNIWYKATDRYGEDVYYNYFVKNGKKTGYYSISFRPHDWGYFEEDYESVKEDILDNFEFEEVSGRFIIIDCLNK